MSKERAGKENKGKSHCYMSEKMKNLYPTYIMESQKSLEIQRVPIKICTHFKKERKLY